MLIKKKHWDSGRIELDTCNFTTPILTIPPNRRFSILPTSRGDLVPWHETLPETVLLVV